MKTQTSISPLDFSNSFSDPQPFFLSLEAKEEKKDVFFSLPKEEMSFLAYHYVQPHHSYPSVGAFCSLKDLPPHTQLLIVQYQETYRVFLSLNHQGVEASFSPRHPYVHFSMQRLHIQAKQASVTLISNWNPQLEVALEKTFQQAHKVTGDIGRLLKDKGRPSFWHQKIGWDTEGLSPKAFHHSSIVNCVKSWKTLGVCIDYVTLGREWQSLLSNEEGLMCLKDFEADGQRFPKGLQGLVQELKGLGVEHVGVCHDVLGAPGGLHPSLSSTYKLVPHPTGRYYLGSDLGQSFAFYFDYYHWLKNQGITFVQVSYQSTCLAKTKDIDSGRLHQNLSVSMQAACSIHFNTTPFVLEGLNKDNLFYWGLSQVAKTASSFSPEVMKKKHKDFKDLLSLHLKQSVWVKTLAHPYYGPVTFEKREHEMQLIFYSLTASLVSLCGQAKPEYVKHLKRLLLPSGEILSASCIAKPLASSLFLKEGQQEGHATLLTELQGVKIMGLFNLKESYQSSLELISPHQAELPREKAYAVFSFKRGFIGKLKGDDQVAVKLQHHEADILHFFPLQQGIAVIGCYRFFLPRAPIKEINIEEEMLHLSSRVESPLLIYCEKEVIEVHKNGKLCEWDYEPSCHLLKIHSGDRACKNKEVFYTIYTEDE